MGVLTKGRHDGAVACQTGHKGDGATMGKLLQVYVFLQLACHGVPQRLCSRLEGLGIGKHLFHQIFLKGHAVGQHHRLGQIERMGDIVIALRMCIQSDEHDEEYGQ